MSMLLNRSVAAARIRIEQTLMPDTCEIQSVTEETSDGSGGFTLVWETTTTVRCQVSDLSAREAVIAEKKNEVIDFEITVPAETAVTALNRIKHTKSAVDTYYTVVGVRDRPTFELARTILARIARS